MRAKYSIKLIWFVAKSLRKTSEGQIIITYVKSLSFSVQGHQNVLEIA